MSIGGSHLKIIPEFYESEFFDYCIAFHEGVGTRLGENHKAFFEHLPSNVRWWFNRWKR
jgi:hypothetical protein